MGNDPVKIAANKGFQATAHKLPLCDRFPSLQSYIVLPVGRRLNPDVRYTIYIFTTPIIFPCLALQITIAFSRN